MSNTSTINDSATRAALDEPDVSEWIATFRRMSATRQQTALSAILTDASSQIHVHSEADSTRNMTKSDLTFLHSSMTLMEIATDQLRRSIQLTRDEEELQRIRSNLRQSTAEIEVADELLNTQLQVAQALNSEASRQIREAADSVVRTRRMAAAMMVASGALLLYTQAHFARSQG